MSRGPRRGSPRPASAGRPTTARRAAWVALRAFAEDPEVRVDAVLDTQGLSGRDRALATEIARGAVRRQRLLDHVVEGLCARGLPASPALRAALRAGAYQLLFLDRVPAHAAVDETVGLVGKRERGFVNAVLRRVAQSVHAAAADASRPRTEVELGPARSVRLATPLPDPAVDAAGHLAIIAGLPGFLVQRWIERHGTERARELAAATDRTPGVHLRAVGIAPDELAARLAAEGVETAAAEHPRVLDWVGGSSPFGTAAFRQGAFVVQDPTAVRAAEAVGAQPGETVLDMCAAPGTKATLVAEAVGPSGRVIAYDVDAERRARIVENAERLRMPWIRVAEDVSGIEGVDRVLVDVPCSNTGVLARRVEVRHRLTREVIDSLARLQRDLLTRGLDAVRPGGVVVYATCSIEPEEDDGVVDAVARTRGDVEVVARVATFPDPPRHDGGYHAVLRRRPAGRAESGSGAPGGRHLG